MHSYPVEERGRLIWIWMGDPALADPELIVDYAPLHDSAWRGMPAYLRETSDIKLASLEADLSMDRYKSLILVLESDTAAARFAAPHRYYFLAEAYRRRDGQGDAKRAEAAYRKSLQEEPLFAPAYRGFGFLYVKLNDLATARPLLEKYLELAPDAKDRAYVEYYLKKPNTGGAS